MFIQANKAFRNQFIFSAKSFCLNKYLILYILSSVLPNLTWQIYPKKQIVVFFCSQNSSSCFPCQRPAKNQMCEKDLSYLYSYIHVDFRIKLTKYCNIRC